MSDVLVRNIKVTIGGPESTPGTATAREYVVPIRAMPGLDAVAEKAEDPVITGANMTRGMFTMAKNLSGNLPISPRCCGGMGQLLNSLLGQESTPTQIAACIRIRYTGSSASCKIAANTSSDELTSDVGALGSESGDTNFGTSGAIDLTASATDTVAELVSVINAYDDYECEKVFGADATDAADIIDITAAQGKSRWVYVWFSSADSGYYLHTWPVVLTNTARPVYSLQRDGMQDDYLDDGVMVNQMELSAALKSMLEGSVDLLGMEEVTDGVTASALTLEDVDPLIFSHGSLALGAYDFTHVRSVSLTMNNNADPEGYGMGSLWRQYHRKAQFSCSGNLKLRHTSNAFSFRAGMFTDAVVGLSFFFRANTNFDGTVLSTSTPTAIPQIMVVEIPYAQVTAHRPIDNNGQLDIDIDWTATNQDGEYSDPVTVSMITDDSGAY